MFRIDQLVAQGPTFSFELIPPKSTRREHQLQHDLPELVALKPVHDDAPLPEGELNRATELIQLAREVGDFCIAVAAHPDGHPDSTDRNQDRQRQAEKLAIADVAITQFFFDADKYFDFVEDMHSHGVPTPVIPGLMAPVNVVQLERMAAMAGTPVPRWVHEQLLSHGDDEEAVADAGVEIISSLAQELLRGGAPGIHVYTMNHSGPATAIFEQLDLKPVQP